MREQPAASRFHAALKSVIKRAIIVLDAMGDREARFLSQGQSWRHTIDDAAMAYGYNDATVRFVPTAREIAQAETVADWLSWLGSNESSSSVRRLVAWAHEDPIWRIADRERCSIRTIHNRIDRSISAIMRQFGGLELDFPEINEPPQRESPPAFMIDRASTIEIGSREGMFRKVWIDGIGFMKDGKRMRTGQEKISDRILNAHQSR